MGRTHGHIVSKPENSPTTPFALFSLIVENTLMEEQEMDWKHLVQFALQGSSNWEPYAILLVRVSLGLFFAISGANKLFVAASKQTMYETLVKAQVPFPRQTAYFVSTVEFVGGSVLAVGLLSIPASVALLVDMLVAILTTKLSAMPKGLSPLNWLDDFLYLPEVLYALFFVWLICSGPGRFSVDYWLAGQLLAGL
jgi:putative oxidoreductase